MSVYFTNIITITKFSEDKFGTRTAQPSTTEKGRVETGSRIITTPQGSSIEYQTWLIVSKHSTIEIGDEVTFDGKTIVVKQVIPIRSFGVSHKEIYGI